MYSLMKFLDRELRSDVFDAVFLWYPIIVLGFSGIVGLIEFTVVGLHLWSFMAFVTIGFYLVTLFGVFILALYFNYVYGDNDSKHPMNLEILSVWILSLGFVLTSLTLCVILFSLHWALFVVPFICLIMVIVVVLMARKHKRVLESEE